MAARYDNDMNAQRTALLVAGVLLVLVGLLWTGQGLGLVGGSVMSGVTMWAIIGSLVAAAGAFLLIRSRR